MKALFILLLACAVFGTAGYFTYHLYVKPEIDLRQEKLAPATPAPPDPTLPEFNKCLEIKKRGQWLEARKAFEDFIERYGESTKLEDAKYELGEINSTIFLTAIPAPEKQLYVVKSGDVINRVAAHTKTTPELIMKTNNLTGTMLRIGQKLSISQASFSITISRKKSLVIVTNNGRFFKQYPVKQWPPTVQPRKKGAPPQPKLAGKVIEKIAWLNGTRVIFTDKGYSNATHWIAISIPHCTFYPEPPPGADPKTYQKPPSGIALTAAATSELAAMLNRGNPVTLE